MVILASNSPRRSELLKILISEFTISPAEIDEGAVLFTSPEEYVEKLARKKAAAVAGDAPEGALIIGADTIVVLDGEVLGKPEDKTHADLILKKLSGRTHSVFTGVAVMQKGGRTISASVCAKVEMRETTPEERAAYIAYGEPMDKAGAYGVQGKGAAFVKNISGDFFAVVGLPIYTLAEMLGEFNITLF